MFENQAEVSNKTLYKSIIYEISYTFSIFLLFLFLNVIHYENVNY